MGDEYDSRVSRDLEKLSLIEGAGASRSGSENHHLLVTLFLTSLTICILSVVVAFHANSTMAQMEVVGTLGDVVAYGISLFTMYYVRGKDEVLRETIEFRTAAFSTALLFCLGIKIAVMCYAQIRCTLDDSYHFHHIPCAEIQPSPNATYVLWMEFGSIALYGPASYVCYYWTDVNEYSPESNINYASAVLHAVVDVLTVVILAGSAGLMMVYPSAEQYIDAFASLLVLIMLSATSTRMWYNYFNRVRTQ